MNWDEIFDQAAEIINLQFKLDEKINHSTIQKILFRNQKYCVSEMDYKSLNNAVLEHQIDITPYQILILRKINELSLKLDTNSIYVNMPNDLEQAYNYIAQLKEDYLLAIHCFDLVIDLETLSTIEYQDDFQNNEYTRKRQMEDKLFLGALDKKIEYSVLEEVIIGEHNKYLQSLSQEQKKELILQTFCLSYSRNVFSYFDIQKVALNSASTKYDFEFVYNALFTFQKGIKACELLNMTRMNLSNLYGELRIIYDTDLLQQKIHKI